MTPLYVKCYACGHKQVFKSFMQDVAGCQSCKSFDIKAEATAEGEPAWWNDSIETQPEPEIPAE